MGTVARIARNLLALTTSLVLERAISFVLFLFIARRLGADALGEYALAFSFLMIFETLSVFGQNLLVVREVARDKESAARYLVNSSLVVLAASLLCAAAMPAVSRLLGYPAETVFYISLMALVLIPDSLASVSEAILQGWERMGLIPLLRFLTNLGGTAIAIAALSGGAGLAAVLYVLVGQRTLLFIAYSWIIWRNHLAGAHMRPDLRFCLKLIRTSPVFMGLNVFAAVFKNVDVWILRSLASAAEVGIYSAADRPVGLVGLAAPLLMTALFPSLAETYRTAPARFDRLLEASLRALAVTVPFIAMLLTLVAPALVKLTYGVAYNETVLPLQILAWALVPTFIATLLFRVLLASNHERVSLRVAFVNMVANLALNLWLIPRGGAVAASAIALATGVLGMIQNYWYVDRHVARIPARQAFLRPLLAVVAAAAVYLLLPGTWHVYVRGAGAAVAYLAVLAASGILSPGEISALRSALGEAIGPARRNP